VILEALATCARPDGAGTAPGRWCAGARGNPRGDRGGAGRAEL